MIMGMLNTFAEFEHVLINWVAIGDDGHGEVICIDRPPVGNPCCGWAMRRR